MKTLSWNCANLIFITWLTEEGLASDVTKGYVLPAHKNRT
jgi:hypothetical protein